MRVHGDRTRDAPSRLTMRPPAGWRHVCGMDSHSDALRAIEGPSPAMSALRRFVAQAGGVSVPVLITGETGTGKSMVARVIHRLSPRADSPFVLVNCAGIPESLFESELFGHEKGAFTGADRSRVGLMEAAAGGTLFLDELGEMPRTQQGKVLTALEDAKVRRVGGNDVRSIDIRLVSGTGCDLASAIENGEFRRDLFHRVAVLHYHIPPLRERPDDALHLAIRLMRTLSLRHGLGEVSLAGDARRFISEYHWPGNVRELAHALEAALILGGGAPVSAEGLEDAVAGAGNKAA